MCGGAYRHKGEYSRVHTRCEVKCQRGQRLWGRKYERGRLGDMELGVGCCVRRGSEACMEGTAGTERDNGHGGDGCIQEGCGGRT